MGVGAEKYAEAEVDAETNTDAGTDADTGTEANADTDADRDTDEDTGTDEDAYTHSKKHCCPSVARVRREEQNAKIRRTKLIPRNPAVLICIGVHEQRKSVMIGHVDA